MDLYFAVSIALATIVFCDQRLNGRSGIGWAFFIFLTSFFGFIIYMLISMDTLQLSARRLRDRVFAERISSKAYIPKKSHLDKSVLILPASIAAEEKFRDEKLEMFLKYRDFRQAREYIENICRLAEERGDEDTPRKYVEYIDRINELDFTDRDWLVKK